MVDKDTLEELERLGFGADVDKLESYIASLQDVAGLGQPLVDDALYDGYVRLLKKVKPDSYVLNRNWEVEETELNEYDVLLKEYGMSSITTITSLADLGRFKSILSSISYPVELMASVKENGHAVRVVYVNGHLYSGTTRGRYKKGRDITRHLKLILPNYIPDWSRIQLVEIRGELLVSIQNFERHLKETLKTPLSSVTSLIRDSSTDNEIKLLEMVAYKVLMGDGNNLKTLWDEFEYLERLGFKTPHKAKIAGVTPYNLDASVQTLLNYFERLMDSGSIPYATDGIVVAINDNSLFYSLGRNGNTFNANFALKAGKYWESNVYSSIIERVVFIPGKSYMVPKAIIKPVVTANGTKVVNVPLYNIGVMERYGYVPGATIYFRYGGETGVTTTDYLGNSCRL